MIRKILTALAAGLLLSIASSGRDFDTTAVNNMIDKYLASIEKMSVREKSFECDFMLDKCEDEDIRNYTAVRLYSHFLSSKLMGDEGVAVHLADEWFIPGKVSFAGGIDLVNARIFAEFNRSSLIGCRAPSLKLETPSGEVREALGTAIDSSGLADGCRRLRVLYFYDTECAACKVETPLLRKMISDRKADVELVAVYCGANRDAWDGYRSYLDTEGPAHTSHYWDPEVGSGFQMKYGVLQTPKMFLLGRDGTILGRGLDTEALAKLLDIYGSASELSYGEYDNMMRMYRMTSGLPADSIMVLADHIERRTLTEHRDTVNFRQLTGDLLYCLGTFISEENAKAAHQLIATKIKGRRDIWSSKNDSLQVIGFANMLDDLLGLCPVGERLPSITVPGVLDGKPGRYNLRKMRNTYIIFHLPGCYDCQRNLEAAGKMDIRSLTIDIDSIRENEPELFETLTQSIDLSGLPFIMTTDRKGRVTRKYVSLIGEDESGD